MIEFNVNKQETIDCQISIPLPTMQFVTPLISWLSVKKTEIKLDVGLLRCLCQYNLTGELSLESIKHMAVGYAIRNFKVGDVFIQQAKIDHEQILIHAIICKITMMYKNSMKLTSFKTYELLHSLPVVG